MSLPDSPSPRVGFVGRLTAQKNIQLLIRAMALRPDITCLIVGEGELRSELEALARTLGCSNVRFLGAQSDAAGLMPLFDVLCLPSLWEGLECYPAYGDEVEPANLGGAATDALGIPPAVVGMVDHEPVGDAWERASGAVSIIDLLEHQLRT